jgi:LacI family transcriptional regulator
VGIKKIAYISGPLTSEINREHKLKAYQDALKKAGISYDERLVVECNNSYEEGKEAVRSLQEVDPTAYFVSNDEMSIGVIHEVEAFGKKIPDDVEIITYENSKLARMSRPMLTAVALPLYDIGAVSMRLLTKYMNNEEIEETSGIAVSHRRAPIHKALKVL